MSIATDRDLLVLEPSLFRDVSFLGQVIYSGQVSLTAGVLTAESGTFVGGSVGAGHVIVVDDRPLEVLERTSGTTVTVSLLRPEADGAAITPADFGSKAASVTTFRPQLALVHRQLLRMLDLVGDGYPDAPGEGSLIDPSELRLCESLGALLIVYTGASAAYGPESPVGRRAELYRDRFARECRRVRVAVDLDGDGRVDAVRTLAVLPVVR